MQQDLIFTLLDNLANKSSTRIHLFAPHVSRVPPKSSAMRRDGSTNVTANLHNRVSTAARLWWIDWNALFYYLVSRLVGCGENAEQRTDQAAGPSSKAGSQLTETSGGRVLKRLESFGRFVVWQPVTWRLLVFACQNSVSRGCFDVSGSERTRPGGIGKRDRFLTVT